MKGGADKVFVRYKNFSDNQPHHQQRQREPKKPVQYKKKYAEKSNKPREAIRQVIDCFEPLTDIPSNIARLIESYPKFFSQEGKVPEKDCNENMNEFVIFKSKKFPQGFHPHKKEKDHEQHSSSDPDWNSDEDIDPNMQSNRIDQAVVERVVERLGDKLTKKPQILKKHQTQFLEDYFRNKRLEEQKALDYEVKIQQLNEAKKKTEKPIVSNLHHDESWDEKETEKPRNIWSQHQEKQVNNFVDMGFMTKVEENEEIQAQLAEDNMFFDDEEEVAQASGKSSSEDDGDDIFGDQHPTTIKASYATNEQKPEVQKIARGTVFINDQIFSKISQHVGLIPSRCVWIISNDKQKYRVSTEYMDTIYRKEKMNEMFPLVSLNHSEFVANDDAQSEESLEVFRKFNTRREKKYQPRGNGFKNQYKEKNTAHPKKK